MNTFLSSDKTSNFFCFCSQIPIHISINDSMCFIWSIILLTLRLPKSIMFYIKRIVTYFCIIWSIANEPSVINKKIFLIRLVVKVRLMPKKKLFKDKRHILPNTVVLLSICIWQTFTFAALLVVLSNRLWKVQYD